MNPLGEYRAWRNRGRAIKEARLLLREGRRVLRRYGARVPSAAHDEVKAAGGALSDAVVARDYDKLPAALNGLDKLLDQHLSFARKSTIREYIESIAVAILIALFLRAFVVEAFKIPSGSMIPTLQVGDHIFVNKFIYGVRIPFTNTKFGMGYRKPKRGEVIVFIYPKNPDQDFIKRIVAVEGDVVEMRENQVYVNDVAIPRRRVEQDCRYQDYVEEEGRWIQKSCDAWIETVNGVDYTTYYDKNGGAKGWPAHKVPAGHVFVMGDNRDNSSDSRMWGFVPQENIKGKAMVIWLSLGEAPEDDFWPIRFVKSIRLERELKLVR
jgi:signal peptidase I